MPKVLTKLRVDEISAVDRAAGEGTRIVLYKRDDSDERRGFYHRLFAGVGKSSGRVARHPPRMRSRDVHSTRAEALHALLFTPDGRALMRDTPNATIDELASHLLEASGAAPPINKSEDNRRKNMREHFDVVSFAKRVVDDGIAAVSEMQATELIKQYSDANRLPGEKPAAAFARIYSGDDDIGLNFRKMVQIAKGIAHPHVGA
jgi:hypothetical protein